ncbi:uncharacterized protein LOC132756248 isoform X2 [Ruditapes philippinarum]|uniref:uncharacterized protein LOC132756248 isoform X2 n=1 Tax=Ruditapes philippinarum TaxID=129788 RepID=UPI00295A9E7A|nr:uncharacterized protein LOC132756248 isoform X2 [Ruditapes philippinarum]
MMDRSFKENTAQGQVHDSQAQVHDENVQAHDVRGQVNDENGKVQSIHGHDERRQGRDAQGQAYDEGGQVCNEQGQVHYEGGQVCDAQGQVYYERGQVQSARGHDEKRQVRAERRQVRDAQGQVHDEKGQVHGTQVQAHGEQAQVHDAHYNKKQVKSQSDKKDKVDEKQNVDMLSVSHMGDKSHGHESDVSQIAVIDRTRVQQTTKKDDSYDAPILLPPEDISGISVRISMWFQDSDKQKKVIAFDVPCTIMQYMKWQFILNLPPWLEQLNILLKRKKIPGTVTSDCVVQVQMKVDNEKVLQDLGTSVFNHAMDELGKSLCVREMVTACNQFDMCMQQLRQEKVGIHAEVLKDKLYIVYRTCDQKSVLESLKDVRLAGDKKIKETIETSLVCIKLAHMMELEKTLKLLCSSTELKIVFETCPDKFKVIFTGPERAVNLAKQEFNRISQHIVSERCTLHIIARSAIPELEVDKVLDEHLSKVNIKCVTLQKTDDIYIYALEKNSLKRASDEIARLIIEKTCIIKGDLKHQKDLLVAQVKQTWPGLVVLHIEESGHLYIVGVKDCVEKASQWVSELQKGKQTLEEFLSMQSAEKVDKEHDDVGPKRRQEKQEELFKVKDDQAALYNNLDKANKETENKLEGKGAELEKTSLPDMKYAVEDSGGKNEKSIQKDKKKALTKTYHKDSAQHVLHDIKSIAVKESQKTKEHEDMKEKHIQGHTRCSNKDIIDDSKPKLTKQEEKKVTIGKTEKKFRKEQNERNDQKSGEHLFSSPDLDTLVMNISHPSHVQFMTKDECRSFLSTCADDHNVTIHQVIDYRLADTVEAAENAVITPEETIERSVLWKVTKVKKILQLTTKQYDGNANPGSRFVNVKFKECRHDKGPIIISNAEPVSVIIRLPEWKDGRGNEEILTDLLTQFLSQTEFADVSHIVMHLEACNGWPISAFIKCIVSETVEGIFLNYMTKLPHMVTLILKENAKFGETLHYINRRIRKYLKAEREKQNKLQVVLMSGELAKTKTDVIVNTTSRDLDLTNGKVSSTLLKAAGQGIQRECWDRYPRGISISKHEVAVTGGHKLHCEKVFHIALDRYIPKQEMNTIESIRTLVTRCLEQASEMKYKTIAFPAIGTGVLRYPIDLVAAAMFESVERFKSVYMDTSLTTVLFVIYPANITVMEIFKKHEESLEKPLEVGRQKEDIPRVQIKISGQTENVEKAKSCVLERCDDELYNPSDKIQVCFKQVTLQEYLLLRHMYENPSVEMEHKNDCLVLSGKRKELKRAADDVEECLIKVRRYVLCSVSVQGCDAKSVEEEMKLVNTNESYTCIFDRINSIVYIYALESRKSKSVQKKIAQKLGIDLQKPVCFSNEQAVAQEAQRLHSEVNTTSERRNVQANDHEHSQQHLNKSVILNDGQEDKKKTTQRKNIVRQFSWTQNTKNMKVYEISGLCVRVYEGDIIGVPVDCIVNPANSNLSHTGGLALSIANAAGNKMDIESVKITASYGGALPVAEVVRTTAGLLPYKCIFHAVGPCWCDYSPLTEESIGDCLHQLKSTTIKCFLAAEQEGLQTIAIPTISSGLFGVPKELCVIQYAKAVIDYSTIHNGLKEIHIVDIKPDMIDIIHHVFDMMIVQKQNIKLDVQRYCQVVTMANAETKHNSKKLTEEIHVSSQIHSERSEHTEKDIGWNVTYAIDGSKLICVFSSNKEVQIYHGDIVKLRGIQALACSENRKGEAKGEVANHLAETNGKDYLKEKSEMFKSSYNYGDIVFTSGGKSCFKGIVHVITPRNDIKALHMMYINLLEKLAKENISSIALPLFGTGSGNFSLSISATVFLEEWRMFVRKYHGYALTIHLILVDKYTSDLVKDIFRQHINAWNGNSGGPSFDAQQQIEEKNKRREEDKKDYEDSKEKKENSDAVSTEIEDDCVICMDKIEEAAKLKCGHQFCKECIEGYFKVKQVCPTCGQVCGVIIGDQPDGTLDVAKIRSSCTGYEGCKTIAMSYNFPPGNQGQMHPRPGAYYRGICRTGFLPDTKEGREICAMLKVAFERRLVFTIGMSRTTGEEGVITWNDIHHKTDHRPGTQFGYPDDTYLQRVREELAVKGVTEQDMDRKLLEELSKETFRATYKTDTTV